MTSKILDVELQSDMPLDMQLYTMLQSIQQKKRGGKLFTNV